MIKLFALILFTVTPYLFAKEITVLSSEGPPHTINDPVNHGIDLDIVKAVLKRLNYQVKFHFVPLGRAEELVKSGQYDAMAPIFNAHDQTNFYISHPIVQYKPTIFSLTKKQITPNKLSELYGHALITFQGAPGYFGKEFKKLALQKDYFEAPDMQVIPELLLKERFDFAVLDKYIFYYFYRHGNKDKPINLFQEHRLIPPVIANAAFRDQQLRDQFNRELVIFLLEGGYQRVVEKYLGKIDMG